MKKLILLFLTLISIESYSQRLVPMMQRVNDYTQTQEDAYAVILAGIPYGGAIIYNTTLAKVRNWNGTQFITVDVDDYLDPVKTVTIATTTYNGNSTPIKTTSAGKYPALDGSLITNVAGGSTTDASLSLTDITTNNSSTSKHGFLPKLDGSTSTFLRGDGTFSTPAGGGTVTSISVTTANGVSGSVATATSTPAITLTLGAITPTTIVASSTISGSNLSGTNTGDQTLPTASTLTGTTLNSAIVTSSLTTIGTLVAGTVPSSLLSGIIPFANNAGTTAATSATTGTMTVNMTTKIITITPSGACTFNGSGGVTGQTSTFVITTSGVSSFVLTWGTNYKTTATLSTGTTTAKIFAVTFLCTNGTQWIEISRTAAQ